MKGRSKKITSTSLLFCGEGSLLAETWHSMGREDFTKKLQKERRKRSFS